MKKIIETQKAPAAVGPYSQAIVQDNILYVSGQIPLDPESGEMEAGGIREQTRRALENLKAIIDAAGFDFAAVIKCTCFLTDMNDFLTFNEVYAKYFSDSLPARECVEVSRLPKDALVEVSAICGAA